MPLDLVIAVMFIGLFHLAVGILIGRHIKLVDEPMRPMFRWRVPEPAAGADLAYQLDSLVRSRLASAPNADLTERLRSLFEEIAKVVEQGRSPTTAPPEIAEQAPPDSARIGSAKWFPVTPLEGSPAGTELRRAKRFAYLRKQAIAPVTGDDLPDASAFVEVLFRDISTNGFSFYTAEEFPVERLVARLGSPPDIVTVLARVVRQSESWQDGQWVFHVGCEIERRVESETASVV
jgi:hypothetical protein